MVVKFPHREIFSEIKAAQHQLHSSSRETAEESGRRQDADATLPVPRSRQQLAMAT